MSKINVVLDVLDSMEGMFKDDRCVGLITKILQNRLTEILTDLMEMKMRMNGTNLKEDTPQVVRDMKRIDEIKKEIHKRIDEINKEMESTPFDTSIGEIVR